MADEASNTSRAITGCVYVVASQSGPVKIGHSARPAWRLKSIQSGSYSPLRFAFLGRCLVGDARRIERSAHRRLKDYRLSGEWFGTSADNAVRAVKTAAKIFGVKMQDCSDGEKVEIDQNKPSGTAIIATKIVSESSSVELYARAEKSKATLKAYESDLRHFAEWCRIASENFVPSSPNGVAAYIAHLADNKKSVSTIMRRLAAIAFAHRQMNLQDPCASEIVKRVTRGIRRTIGAAPKQKAAATAKFVKAMLKPIPDTMLGKRDRAILLIGFAGALRRSELVALDVGDIERRPEGVLIHVRKSKTDQEGLGQTVAIPRGTKMKPVEALEDWMAAAAVTAGPLFRPVSRGGRALPTRLSDQAVALVIKSRAGAAKLDAKMFSGHSLRAGYVSEALAHGADVLRIMDQTRHRSTETLKKYDRRAKAFVGHSGSGFL